MAIIHDTTMEPGKLELLAAWLPAQPWHLGGAGELREAGGFRLDDPAGEVGLEFMAVGKGEHVYHVPLAYRGAPLDGAEHALVGTSEHGVLGRRWVYDGAYDPVLQTQVLALLQGRAEPQDQDVSGVPNTSVTGRCEGVRLPDGPKAVVNGAQGTDLVLEGLTVRVVRVLRPEDDPVNALGWVMAEWSKDGGKCRGPVVVLAS